MCHLPQLAMSTVITETLRNLQPAFKRLIREPFKGKLKSNPDLQPLQVFLKILGRMSGEGGGLGKRRRERNCCMSSCI